MSRLVRHTFCALVAAAIAGHAGAQLIGIPALPPVSVPPPVSNLPVAGPVLQDVLAQPGARQAITPNLDTVGGLTETIANSGASDLLELRRLRLDELIRTNRATVESDGNGLPVRRGIVAVLDPDVAGLQIALRGGFRIARNQQEQTLGLRIVSLAVPTGMSARAGLKLLQRIAPKLQADFDHLFEPAGGPLAASAGAIAVAPRFAGGGAIGMIDGGVASHPSLAGSSIEQNGFAGAPKPTGHGTAIASLLVGRQGPFRGAAIGARLFVADVYGGDRAAGSATAIVRALSWLAGRQPQVITISLVGPANKIVQRAIEIVQSQGIQVVAAIGNDGPAAPPQFPASYPGSLRSPQSMRSGGHFLKRERRHT